MLNNEENNMGTVRIKQLYALFYLLIVNFAIDILMTLLNIFFTPNYFSELLYFGAQNALIFIVVMIITLLFTIIPIIFGQKYKEWSEEKQTKVFFKILTIISVTLISLASFIVYFTIYSQYPILMNPFRISSSNQILSILSPFWWFFSFNVGIILIFLLYIYLES